MKNFLFIPLSFVLLGCFKMEEDSYPRNIELKESKGIVFSTGIKTDLMLAKLEKKVHLDVIQEKQSKVRLNISSNNIQIRIINKQNNFQMEIYDDNCDGIPERRLVFEEKGKLVRKELFYQGNFIEANYLNKKWQTKKGELIYKNGFWQLANSG